MDLLHKRYAEPFPFVDSLIENMQFKEYIQFLLNKEAEEKNAQMLWEYYLHKVYDKSFNDFKKDMLAKGEGESRKNDVMDEAKRNEIINKSNSILNGFVPEQ